MGSSDSPPPRTPLRTIADRLTAACRRPLTATVAFWGLAALVAGTSQYAAARTAGGAASWLEHVLPLALASALWVPLTLAVLWLTRRWPPRPLGRLPGTAVHVFGALAVSFVLNAAFIGVLVVLGRMPAAGSGTRVLRLGLHWMHLNAGVYAVIVAIGLGLATRRPRVARGEVAERLEVSSGTATVYLPVEEIDWIEGAGDYTCVHAGTRELLCDQRLMSLEHLLGPRAFVRVHRSRIVNLERVRKMRHLSHGDYEAELVGGERLRVSRGRRQEVLAALERLTVDRESSR